MLIKNKFIKFWISNFRPGVEFKYCYCNSIIYRITNKSKFVAIQFYRNNNIEISIHVNDIIKISCVTGSETTTFGITIYDFRFKDFYNNIVFLQC